MTNRSTNSHDELPADDEPIDEQGDDHAVPNVTYDVTSYGADPDVEGLVRRLKKAEIIIPPFQRSFVWNQPEASRFIESLLLGLPVPGIFFATDPDTNKHLVVDGQQRLKTLLFYREGLFNPKANQRRHRVFSLQRVQPRFEGKTYKELDERDRLRLDNSVIHATIIQQTSPPGDDTSVYHIFERLNSGGRRLTAQEIRVALYHGNLMEMVCEANTYPAWRTIFGTVHSRLKDQELILRFLALQEHHETYNRPMTEFLNKFSGRNKNLNSKDLLTMRHQFEGCVELFLRAVGREVFRPDRALNAAVYDSCMIGLATRLRDGNEPTNAAIASAYSALLRHDAYLEATSRSTADKAFVERRIEVAKDVFSR